MTSTVSPSVAEARLRRTALFVTALLSLVVGVLTMLPPSVPEGVPGGDKLHHVMAFAGLALPAALLAPRLLWWLLPLLTFYGALIEVVQPWVGRYSDIRDALADTVGLMVGICAGLVIRRLLSRRLRTDETRRAE